MKRRVLAVLMLVLSILCNLSGCGGESSPFRMKKEKGEEGYVCYGFNQEEDAVSQLIVPGSYKGEMVRAVGSSAFRDSTVIQMAILSEGIREVEEYAFLDCKALTSVSLPKSLAELELSSFAGCSALREIYIPSGVTKISQWAFSNCTALERVVIDGPIEDIDREAFRNCSSLKVIYLPDTLQRIVIDAFDGCDALEEIHFAGTVEAFFSLELMHGWMSAKDVLIVCADGNILMQDKNTWTDADREPVYPMNPADAIEGVAEQQPGQEAEEEAESSDWSDPGPDEVLPGGEPDAFVNTSQVTQTIAPFEAIALAHKDWIYYIDDDSNLWRADREMQERELFCERPFGTYLDNDLESINIIGVSDTDVMYLTGGGRSFVLDLATAAVQELITPNSNEEVRLYGMSGEWMYYTRSHSSGVLCRSHLSDGFASEEELAVGDLKDIYVTDTYLMYVLDEGKNWSLYTAPLADIYAPGVQDSGSGDYNAIFLAGAQGVVAVYSKGGSYVLRDKYYACDMASGLSAGGSAYPVGVYTYVPDQQRIYFFKNFLASIKLEEIEGTSYYYNEDAYQSDIDLGWRLTYAGGWFFFRGTQAGGGAEYCVDMSGERFMDLSR